MHIEQSMVFDQVDYEKLYAQPAFTEGLLQLLSARTHLFLGFSFRDPGIDAVLRMWKELKGPLAFPRKHYAILPTSAGSLKADLTPMNVEVLTYDDSAGSHQLLWDAIKEAARLLSQPEHAVATSRTNAASVPALAHVKNVLAFAYARASLGHEIQPLRNCVIDGLVLGAISEHTRSRISVENLVTMMATRLGIPSREAEPEIQSSLQRLVTSSACKLDGNIVTSEQKVQDSLTNETRRLAQAVAHRVHLRSGTKVEDEVLEPLRQLIEDLLVARAWDVAAHFVQPLSGNLHRIDDAVSYLINASPVAKRADAKLLEAAIVDLLVRPDSKEASILAELGRVAFAAQLALGNARTVLAYSLTLPQKIYLDASVLMPAIVDGHPLHDVYRPVLTRLRHQARSIGADVAVVAPLEFLNEVISHRRNSLKEVADRGLENLDVLQREVQIYGAENLNVFISAYATHVGGRKKPLLSYSEFLESYAPYSTESALQRFLETEGFRVEPLEVSPQPSEFWDWYNALSAFYERREDLTGRKLMYKVLIKHEAWQLYRLAHDGGTTISMFVTADGQLRKAVASIREGELADSVMTGLTMANLIDLLLGVKVDHRGLARLLWGVHAIDVGGVLRRYFTDKALERRDEVSAMVAPEVADRIMEKAQRDPAFKQLRVGPHEGSSDRTRVAAFLDRFEVDFYKLLDEAVEKRKAQIDQRSVSTPPGKAKHLWGGKGRSKYKQKQNRRN